MHGPINIRFTDLEVYKQTGALGSVFKPLKTKMSKTENALQRSVSLHTSYLNIPW